MRMTKRGFDLSAAISLVPFHGFSSTIKPFDVALANLLSHQVLDLILSFPLLEDLIMVTDRKVVTDNGNGSDGLSTAIQPLSSPPSTGSLVLHLGREMEPVAHRLSSLPGGIHFWKLELAWHHKEDLSSTMALVKECSHTLESLHIICNFFGTPPDTRVRTNNLVSSLASSSINLSKAKKLKDVVFLGSCSSVQWVITALHTITPNHRSFKQITLSTPSIPCVDRADPANVRRAVGERICGEWLELDHLLV